MPKITIKRKTSSGTDTLYPTTTLDQIISEGTGAEGANESLSAYLSSTYIAQTQLGADNGVATLDGNGQLTISQLPVAVMGGLSFEGTISMNGGKTVDQVLAAININAANINIGDYLQVSAAGDLTQGSTYTGGVNAPGDEGDYDISDGITLEAGDWIVVTAINTSNSTVSFGIINNTYKDANTSVKGIVQLSNESDTTGTTSKVITESVLGNLVVADSTDLSDGTSRADLIAPAAHNHDTAYEPVFSKNTAFNKNFGSTAGTVAEGNHNHTGTYLRLSGADTMTGDLALGAEGIGTAEDSISLSFTARAANVSFSKELKMPTTGELTFNDKRVYTIEDTTMGRLFYDTTTGAVEGDFIFDDDATA